MIRINFDAVRFQDPNRTKSTKARKLLARKKRKAFIHRKEKHEEKERIKFKPATSRITSKATPLPHAAQEWIGVLAMHSTSLTKSQVQLIIVLRERSKRKLTLG
jgi:hypothetical protein